MLCGLGLLNERPVLGLKGKILVGLIVLGAMAQSFPLRANNCPVSPGRAKGLMVMMLEAD